MEKFRQIGIDVDINRVIEASRLSFAETENDILRRLLLQAEQTCLPGTPAMPLVSVTELDPPQFGSRNTGFWQAGLKGNVLAATSLKDAYCKFVLLAHRQDKLFFRRFAKLQARTRKYVAEDPRALYLKSPHLAKDHAVELTPGWFIDCNLSESQIGQRARAASRELGIQYGKEAWIREAARTI